MLFEAKNEDIMLSKRNYSVDCEHGNSVEKRSRNASLDFLVRNFADAPENRQYKETNMSTDPTSLSESAFNLGLTWNNGIGNLPGSDLQFRMNENGDLEVVSDDEKQNILTDTNTKDARVDVPLTTDHTRPRSAQVSTSEGKAPKCVSCSAVSSSSAGRFCSEKCVARSVLNISQRHEAARRLSSEIDGESHLPNSDAASRPSAGGKAKFSWKTYLELSEASPLGEEVFATLHGKSPFPTQPNPFKLGSYVEAVDPDHQSLICLMRVAQVQGYRLRLHFVGDHACYDWWTNADSPFVFPHGFCKRTGRKLHVARHFPLEAREVHVAQLAPPEQEDLFVRRSFANSTSFRIGQKLEAVDRKNRDLTCVATVVDAIGDHVLIHFDGWHSEYDYWARCNSPLIQAVGWCQTNQRTLAVPPNHKGTFAWSQYLKATKSRAAPVESFEGAYDHRADAKVGAKLEVVDQRNPALVRVASLVDVDEHRVKVHYDGWPEGCGAWFDVDSLDIHPPTWCLKTGHLLQPPLDDAATTATGCGTSGCDGMGHVRRTRENVYRENHDTQADCPYLSTNHCSLPDRLDPELQGQEQAAVASSASGGAATARAPVVCKASAPSRHRGKKRKNRKILQAVSHEVIVQTAEPQSYPPPKSPCLSPRRRSPKCLPLNPCTQEPFAYRWDRIVHSLPGVDDVTRSDVIDWDIAGAARFVEKLTGKRECAENVRREEVDGEALMLLTQEDITQRLNIKLGPALKIFNATLMLRSMCDV